MKITSLLQIISRWFCYFSCRHWHFASFVSIFCQRNFRFKGRCHCFEVDASVDAIYVYIKLPNGLFARLWWNSTAWLAGLCSCSVWVAEAPSFSPWTPFKQLGMLLSYWKHFGVCLTNLSITTGRQRIERKYRSEHLFIVASLYFLSL